MADRFSLPLHSHSLPADAPAHQPCPLAENKHIQQTVPDFSADQECYTPSLAVLAVQPCLPNHL